jgi:hypothetical protein
MNLDAVALATERASLKVVNSAPIPGTITAPAATSSNSPQSSIVQVSHGQNSSDVIINLIADGINVYGSTRYITAPWATPDGRISLDVYVDSDNVYIKAISSTAGTAQPATTFNYHFDILIP